MLGIGNAGCDNSLDGKGVAIGVPACRKGLMIGSKETLLGKTSLWAGEYHVGGHEAIVTVFSPPHLRDDGSEAGMYDPSRFVTGLGAVGGRLMGEDAMSHAADNGVVVRLFGQSGKQFADPDAWHIGGNGALQGAGIVVSGFRFGIKGV